LGSVKGRPFGVVLQIVFYQRIPNTFFAHLNFELHLFMMVASQRIQGLYEGGVVPPNSKGKKFVAEEWC
jgi:hypothetical protein